MYRKRKHVDAVPGLNLDQLNTSIYIDPDGLGKDKEYIDKKTYYPVIRFNLSLIRDP